MFFINLTNHHSSGWSEKQKAAAIEMAAAGADAGNVKIFDTPFPIIDPEFSEDQVSHLARCCAGKIFNILQCADEIDESGRLISPASPPILHLMGEQSFCLYMFLHCKKIIPELRIVVSTTRRDVVEEAGVKKSIFKFVRFRELKEEN